MALGRKHRRAGHQHQHDLVGRKAALDEHVPQKALVRVLVVGRHFEGLATDCCFYDKNGLIIPSKIICCVAFDLGELNGIAKIDENYVHLDNRKNSTYYGDETRGNSSYWNNPYIYFGVSEQDVIKYTGTNNRYQVHTIEKNTYYR